MARREVTQYFDDLDNSPLEESEVRVVDFAVNGIDYTLDVSAENQQKFNDALAPFMQVARRKPRRGVSPRRSTTRTSNPAYNKRVREWAQANGVEVSDRGRIAQDVIDKFEKAQGR